MTPAPGARLRVLLAGGDGGTPSYRYRVDHTREQLRLAGLPVAVLPHGVAIERLPVGSGAAGVVILHRVGLDAWAAHVVRWARGHGWRVVADIDDFVFDLEVTPWVRGLEVLAPGSRRGYDTGVALYRRCLEAADAIVLPTAFLAREAARLGRPTHVHPNSLSLPGIALAEAALAARTPRPAGAPPTIGYFSGTHTHNHDFRACSAALAGVLERHPDVRLRIVGPLDLDAGMERVRAQIVRQPAVDWARLPQLIAQVDVNLAPLETGNPFCQAKSEIKYIEAAVLGVPTVASPTEAFCGAIEHGRNGLLAADPAAWAAALEQLVQDAGLRARLGEEARRDVDRRYHPNVAAARLTHILQQVAARPG